jgi:hypothetical protein
MTGLIGPGPFYAGLIIIYILLKIIRSGFGVEKAILFLSICFSIFCLFLGYGAPVIGNMITGLITGALTYLFFRILFVNEDRVLFSILFFILGSLAIGFTWGFLIVLAKS